MKHHTTAVEGYQNEILFPGFRFEQLWGVARPNHLIVYFPNVKNPFDYEAFLQVQFNKRQYLIFRTNAFVAQRPGTSFVQDHKYIAMPRTSKDLIHNLRRIRGQFSREINYGLDPLAVELIYARLVDMDAKWTEAEKIESAKKDS